MLATGSYYGFHRPTLILAVTLTNNYSILLCRILWSTLQWILSCQNVRLLYSVQTVYFGLTCCFIVYINSFLAMCVSPLVFIA